MVKQREIEEGEMKQLSKQKGKQARKAKKRVSENVRNGQRLFEGGKLILLFTRCGK